MFPGQYGPNEKSVKLCYYFNVLFPFIHFNMKTNIFLNPADRCTQKIYLETK